ncbi:hypothetical protein [Leptospira stimsonii]|uniref:Flagellar assembly protein T N-terminal domain-containing protein n=1 Tax=Leptospira stimsonii TaxID=2202203 RepID=A0ABY2NDG8_9LEPT|nr:hypothetical protein [Leptospira stimsonii]TGK14228.1 hypothetical protein EHO98_17735 [Leptospira stimsonii]TGM22081.1 hypothetical protein EHQ90_01205 [Leptospira stimsonii]
MLKIGKNIPIAIFCFIVSFCFSLQNANVERDKVIYVQNVQGINLDDLELNAKRKILENGLGELIEGSSQTIDGRIQEMITDSSTEGFVTEFAFVGDIRKKGNLVEADAKGRVNRKAVEDALKERYRDLGKPKFLMIIDEKILGKSNGHSFGTISENTIVKKFAEFDFLDKNQFSRILEKEGGKTIEVYGNQSFEGKAINAAAEMEAQILLVGQVEVKDAGELEGSGIHSYQAILRFKIFDVNTARIIAADNTNGAIPHVSAETGTQEAIRKAVEKAYPKIRDQISSKWKAGNLIRVKLEGISYDDYVDKDVKGLIRSIKGVNGVSEVASGNKNRMIVLEVEALFSGSVLYQKMRERKNDFGFDFTQKEVKSSSLHIIKK